MGSAEMKKKLPVGIESFEKIRTEGFYYVDKTAMIRDLLLKWGEVNLFTRPRRFGKSLNMSMLKCFFEIGCDRTLFQGLEILNETALCDSYMGKFPVISISLKSVNGSDYAMARSIMCTTIGKEALRFYFLLDSDRLTVQEREMYRKLINVDAEKSDYFDMSDDVLMGSLRTLSSLLHKHYGKKVILLIDEYDVPLAKANEQGYYDQMVFMIRNLFEQALKTNDHLYFSVLTGCLRVSKESIFTGLNNPKVLSVTTVRFDEYFGFTDEEVQRLLKYYCVENRYESVKEWYDGYRFGNVDVYCPWDVISYCDELTDDPAAQPQNYWINTSSNDAVKMFITKSENATTKREIERLVAGEVITKEIHQELTYKDMYDSIENIWSVLFTTGYLTQRGALEGKCLQLAIPNMEIRDIFKTQIMEYFKETVLKNGETLNRFCDALKNGDAEAVERGFEAYLKKTISIRDSFAKKELKENFYHGILLGILGVRDQWGITSNREAGDGYGDILVETEDGETGILIEVKYAQDGDLDAACRKALKQMEDKKYEEALWDDGVERILKYGIACYKKRCKVMLAE